MNSGRNLLSSSLIITLIACGGGGGGSTDGSTTYTVTSNAGANGSISPTSAEVNENATTAFTVTPDSGFAIDSVSGCGGTLTGNSFTTGPVTADCAVVATFRTASPPVAAASPTLSFIQVKGFRFDWTDVGDATFYRILENPDGASGFTQTGVDIPQGTGTGTVIVPLHRRLGGQYILQSCNADGCTDSALLSVAGTLVASIGYFKASNTDRFDRFAASLSLSADGNTLAVGAADESSSATGINGDQADDSAPFAGAVYVFSRSSGSWSQQAYIKASNSEQNDVFGWSVNLSADGNTLAVGAIGESSNATGVNGSQSDNSATEAGAVYVFTRNATAWSQQAYLKASNADAMDRLGYFVELSGDGNTLATSALSEDSNATGINSDQSNNAGVEAGAVYVFNRNGAVWSQQAYVKASNTDTFDQFGRFPSLSTDGNTLAVGASGEDSNATGVDGDQLNNLAVNSGAVYVFSRTGSNWAQQTYIKASNAATGDNFARSLSLSADGTRLAVGASGEDSNATGVDGDQLDNTATDSGAVYVYQQSVFSAVWVFQTYVKASNPATSDFFGTSVSLSADGHTLAVGATGEDSNATGLNGDQANNSANNAGAAYVFSRNGSTWTQQAYIKASNTGASDFFGGESSLSADGSTLAIGAFQESSDATGIGGDQGNNSAANSGAVYLY